MKGILTRRIAEVSQRNAEPRFIPAPSALKMALPDKAQNVLYPQKRICKKAQTHQRQYLINKQIQGYATQFKIRKNSNIGLTHA
jgi:hypothetical protein